MGVLRGYIGVEPTGHIWTEVSSPVAQRRGDPDLLVCIGKRIQARIAAKDRRRE